jgi:hypothetical protein
MKLIVPFTVVLVSTHISKIQSFTLPSSSLGSRSRIKYSPYLDVHRKPSFKVRDLSIQSQATDDLAPGIDAINSMNGDLEQMLNTLRDQPYFRLYSVDMLGSCEYMPQELFECYSQTCEIYPADEDEVSQEFLAEK